MYRHRVFKILDGEENVTIFVPSLPRVYRVSPAVAEKIPGFIENNKPYFVSQRDSLPDYTFFGTNLILTNHCNLKCVYCYEDAGPKKKTFMSERIVFAAIDYITSCAQKFSKKLIHVNMFGGEPTQAWDILISAARYLRQKAETIGCRSRATITTNGCMSLKKAEWLAKNMDGISISFDGPKEIQDVHRSNSFDRVFEITKMVYSQIPTKVAFRSTISSYSVEYLPDIVYFFGKNFPGCKQLHEPLFAMGRGKDSKYAMPSSEIFFTKFLEALPIAEKFGCKLKTSVLNLGAKSSDFCGVAGRNFMITPDGRCTSCNRMTDDQDVIASHFIYGIFDASRNAFVFDNNVYQQLKKIGVRNIPECFDCFAATSCRSDCVANKAVMEPKNFWTAKSYRCEEIRQFVKDILRYVLDRESFPVNQNCQNNPSL